MIYLCYTGKAGNRALLCDAPGTAVHNSRTICQNDHFNTKFFHTLACIVRDYPGKVYPDPDSSGLSELNTAARYTDSYIELYSYVTIITQQNYLRVTKYLSNCTQTQYTR